MGVVTARRFAGRRDCRKRAYWLRNSSWISTKALATSFELKRKEKDVRPVASAMRSRTFVAATTRARP